MGVAVFYWDIAVQTRTPMSMRLLIVTLARTQALEAHKELTWGAVEFDNKMETLSVARRQKLSRANKNKKRKRCVHALLSPHAQAPNQPTNPVC